jgi:hypothetical protein
MALDAPAGRLPGEPSQPVTTAHRCWMFSLFENISRCSHVMEEESGEKE